MLLVLPAMRSVTSAGLMHRRSGFWVGKGEVTLLMVSQWPGLSARWRAAGAAAAMPRANGTANSGAANRRIGSFILRTTTWDCGGSWGRGAQTSRQGGHIRVRLIARRQGRPVGIAHAMASFVVQERQEGESAFAGD